MTIYFFQKGTVIYCKVANGREGNFNFSTKIKLTATQKWDGKSKVIKGAPAVDVLAKNERIKNIESGITGIYHQEVLRTGQTPLINTVQGLWKAKSGSNNGIGDRVRIIRLREDMSQKEFAEALGCSRVTITNIELSRHQPSLKTLTRLRRQFKVPYNYSIEGIKSVDVEKKESELAHKIEMCEMERASMQTQIEGLITQIDLLKQLNAIYKDR